MRRPNVILITIDSLRADRVGPYRPAAIGSLTPELDRLAERAVVFERCHSQGPFTAFSMPSLFTGKYPCHLRRMVAGLRTGGEHQAGRLVAGTPTLTEKLRGIGYHTGGFHSNPLLSRLFGFDAGFEEFYDDVLDAGASLGRRAQLNLARLQRVIRVDPFMGAAALNRKAASWIERARRPFFLWVHYMDAHGPYLSRKVLRGISPSERLWSRSWRRPNTITPPEREKLMGNYARQIRLVDGEIGDLFRNLEARGCLDDAVWALTADHGDEFYEHGGYSHRHKLYRELTHVPLFVAGPGLPPGRRATLASLLQVAPTLLELAGAAAEGCDAPSLGPVLRGAAAPAAWVISEVGVEPHETLAIRRGDWALIWQTAADTCELFHLPTDPDELRNVAGQNPGETQALLALLRHHRYEGDAAPVRKEAEPTISDSDERLVEQRLRDLGYI